MEMFFVDLRWIRKAFDRTPMLPKIVLRWHASNDRPHVYGFPLSESLMEWLDSNCVGRWYEVINRKHAMEDIFMSTETKNLFREVRVAKTNNQPNIDQEVLRRATSTREIAFTNKNDALIFKLLWCGDV
jgi:hypothetical protein